MIATPSAADRPPLSRRPKRAAALALAAALVMAPAAHASVDAAVSNTTASERKIDDAFEALVAEAKASMMSDPGEAAARAGQAEALARDVSGDAGEKLATALWLKGEALLRAGKPKSAAAPVEEALAILGAAADGEALYANLLLARGRIASRNSDVATAVKSFFAAHDQFAQLGDARKESMTLQAIGSIYRDAESHEKAIEYYERAMEVYPGDNIVDLSSYNNRANILRDMRRFDEARGLFKNALDMAEKIDSDVLAGRILTNVAELESSAGEFRSAERYAETALARLQNEGGADWARFAVGAKARARFKQGDMEGAEALIDQAFADIDIDATNASFTPLHETAYEIHLMRGDAAKALAHHQSMKRLSDEAKKVASSANLALTAARFDLAEQRLNVERLRNERLEKNLELEDARRRVEAQRAALAFAGVVVLFAFTIAVAFRNNRNRIASVNERLEKTVRDLNDEIARRVATEKELVAAKDEAERAARIKSTFLATMSHELRTPLNGILGFTKILLNGALDDEQREQIEIIDQSGESLLTLINDILDVSAIEAGKLTLQPTSINLRATVTDAVSLLKAKAEEDGLTLGVHIDPDLPQNVIADGARLRQVLINLVGNAIKFTDAGGVAVMVDRDPATQDVRIAVADSGIGIASDKLALLFERFSQVDGSPNRRHGGSGLGLAICKEIVEAMDGGISVTSEMGVGSEFVVTAPFAADEEVVPLPVDRSRRFDRPTRVMIVDAADINQRVLGRILASMNAEAVPAASGERAIAKLAEMREQGLVADAVIVSNALTDIEPAELLRRLKRNGLARDAASVLVSAQKLSAEALGDMGYSARIDTPVTEKTVYAGVTGAQAQTGRPARAAAIASGKRPPLRRDIASAGASNVVSLIPGQTAGRVLVVDDNDTNRKLVAAALKTLNVAVDLAENGAEATEACGRKRYAAILMDVQMPVMNGLDATRAIRSACPNNSRTKIIALTASDTADDARDIRDAGMDDVMTKPVNVARLRALIEECVRADSGETANDETRNCVRGVDAG